jgi:hypothetical protein
VSVLDTLTDDGLKTLFAVYVAAQAWSAGDTEAQRDKAATELTKAIAGAKEAGVRT